SSEDWCSPGPAAPAHLISEPGKKMALPSRFECRNRGIEVDICSGVRVNRRVTVRVEEEVVGANTPHGCGGRPSERFGRRPPNPTWKSMRTRTQGRLGK